MAKPLGGAGARAGGGWRLAAGERLQVQMRAWDGRRGCWPCRRRVGWRTRRAPSPRGPIAKGYLAVVVCCAAAPSQALPNGAPAHAGPRPASHRHTRTHAHTFLLARADVKGHARLQVADGLGVNGCSLFLCPFSHLRMGGGRGGGCANIVAAPHALRDTCRFAWAWRVTAARWLLACLLDCVIRYPIARLAVGWLAGLLAAGWLARSLACQAAHSQP